MSKEHLIDPAFNLYCAGKTYEQISSELQEQYGETISVTWLSEWAQKYDWKKRRLELRKNPLQKASDIQQVTGNIVEKIKLAAEAGNIEEVTLLSDSLSKLAKLEHNFGKIENFTRQAAYVMKEFSRFVAAQKISTEIMQSTSQLILQFLDGIKKKEFGEDL